jgi:hypothetical protein
MIFGPSSEYVGLLGRLKPEPSALMLAPLAPSKSTAHTIVLELSRSVQVQDQTVVYDLPAQA